MLLHHGHLKVPENAKGAVLAIGNFDGVHLGHRSLIAAARNVAERLQAPLAVMTFEPHPREFFQKGNDPFRLTLLPMKARLFEPLGVRALFALPFDETLAAMTAEDFMAGILEKSLAIRHAVTGEDFTFGKGRAGNVATLKSAKTFGTTAVTPARCEGLHIYSSTRIRHHVATGDFDAAENLMGHAFEMEAEVVQGDRRGRTLGWPTANQNVPRYARMPYGIYATRVLIEGESVWRDAVSSFGLRPMFAVQEPLLETHIFDLRQDIYGKILRVRPVRFLRPELKFDSLDALKARMDEDGLEAKAVLKSR